MGPIDSLENVIRTMAQTKRIRITEFFKDFDKLRYGFVTESQFSRCLWQTLGIQLNPEEQAMFTQKYGGENGTIKYTNFCKEIDRDFNPRAIHVDPDSQKIGAPEFLGTMRSVRPLSPERESQLAKLLQKMYQFYEYHGINLRTCYEDFDSHHKGVVTESQFYRSFPGPPDISEEEKDLLVSKYHVPDQAGLLNYLNLHHDLVAVGQALAKQKELIPSAETMVDLVHPMFTPDPALNSIFDKIRVAVFKNGIRTTEFFKDHDKLRSGIISENQFVCGLALSVGKEAQLSRPEMQKIVEYYRQPDGRIQYKEFCDMMENAFNIPDLEKKPLQSVVRPARGALFRGLKALSEAEETRVQNQIQKLAVTVRQRRLMMCPYFKDYDRGTGYTRVVTASQFARILHFLNLQVPEEDMKLLVRKFEDPASGDVNYPAFVQAVDQEFVGHTMDNADISQKGRTNTSAQDAPTPPTQSTVSFEDLMARIRHLVLVNRCRVAEFFEDYDPLRSGSISKTQFRRGVALLGFDKLGSHDLQPADYQMLVDYYQDPKKDDMVMWTQFEKDVETVFTQPHLEKDPNQQVPPQEIYRVPKPGTVQWENASNSHRELFDNTMLRLKQRVEQRRLLIKPVFQDFDKHNNGHVTKSQFRQCLMMLELHCSEPEMIALEAKFCNDTGFNYLKLLAELQPEETPQLMYVSRLEEIRAANARKTLPELNVCEDIEGILTKIKTKVSRERLRVYEFFRDYDKLRSGRVVKTSFRRALDLCKFELQQSEMSLLEDQYQSMEKEDYVDYLRFVDEVESIFTTKELEKAPLQDVIPFKPPNEWEQNNLGVEQEQKLNTCLSRISEKVRKQQMQLFPLFEDYDRVHNGTVSKSQFRRVLTELELGSLVSQQDFEILAQRFDVRIGGMNVVNYIGFCDTINDLAKFEWRKP